MGSREKILAAVRSRTLAPVAAPDLAQAWITYADRRKQFAEMLQFVGGRCLFVESREQIAAAVAEHASWAAAKKIVSIVPEVAGNVELANVDDPHQLEDVDFAVLSGRFGVAENGAVWVDAAPLRQRAILFIVQHLVLVIDAAQLVDNMHDAYLQLQLGECGFGAFISGPSKTADIEQSLVIGAHGPRSHMVICVGGAGV